MELENRSASNQIISRQGLSYYQRNQRPLLGSGVQEYVAGVGVGMLDSTICDIYLVNEAEQLVGLVDISPDRIRQVLLPRTTARFTRRGLIVNKLRYRPDGFCDEYLDGKTVSVAYDLDNVSTVWLLEDGNYTALTLIDSRFKGQQLEAVRELKERQKELFI